jgi:hypothetical protein
MKRISLLVSFIARHHPSTLCRVHSTKRCHFSSRTTVTHRSLIAACPDLKSSSECLLLIVIELGNLSRCALASPVAHKGLLPLLFLRLAKTCVQSAPKGVSNLLPPGGTWVHIALRHFPLMERSHYLISSLYKSMLFQSLFS